METVARSGHAALLAGAALAVLAGCSHGGAPAVTSERIQTSGGRVAWYKGAAAGHELIAFDRIVDAATQDTEVFVMRPDGAGVACVTCANPDIPKGFIGQPEWHPDGQHLVIQAENANSGHTRYNHVAWGIDQDLWIVAIDGTGARKIYDNSAHPHHAALHPHFDASGSRLIFSERIATGVVLYSPALTPGGENPWAGWRIHLSDYEGSLTSHTVLYGGGLARDRGLYETHGFHGNRIVYSATAGGAAYVDDVFSANPDGTGAVNLTDSPSTWEEHGSWSPSGAALVFISSRVDPAWRAPRDNAGTLRTELYIEKDGVIEPLTSFNARGDPDKRYLTSDFDWDRTGRRIAVQVAPVDAATGAPYPPEIWLLTFPEAQ